MVVVVIILVALLLLAAAIAVPGLLALWKYPRRFGWRTRGFDTPAYLWRKQDERARRRRERPDE